MIAVPWHVDQADVSLFANPIYSRTADAPYTSDESLTRLKQKIGEMKVKYGEAAWKESVALTDTNNRQEASTTTLGERPLSRAYFKLREIIKTCVVAPPSVCLLLCEAPGGFGQAILSEFPTSKAIHVMSLRRKSILFHASVLQANKCFHLDDLPHFSDICFAAVREGIVSRVPSADLITADGAIDSDSFPELTEARNSLLIGCEIETALACQAQGGTFILKVFSISLPITIQFVALLASCYTSVSVIKPYSSRAVNDERYVVCQGFDKSKAKQIHIPDMPDDSILEGILHVDEAWKRALCAITKTFNLAQERAIQAAIFNMESKKKKNRKTLTKCLTASM